MQRSLCNRYLAPGLFMLLTSGLMFTSPAHSLAFYDASIEANLTITTQNPELLVSPAFGFTDYFADVYPAGPGTDAFGDADFFSTPDGFSAYAHADGIAVPGGLPGDTVVVDVYIHDLILQNFNFCLGKNL